MVFAEADQLAEIDVHAEFVPAVAVGTSGVAGDTVTANVLAAEIPQEFCAVTLIFPSSPGSPVVTVIEVVPAPAVIVHPVGTDQLYEVALATAPTE